MLHLAGPSLGVAFIGGVHYIIVYKDDIAKDIRYLFD